MTTFKRNFDFNENIIEIIAQNIRKYRIEKKITQEQLAIDIGVSPEYYRKFESALGSEGISLTTVYKISVVLGVSIDKFFEEQIDHLKETIDDTEIELKYSKAQDQKLDIKQMILHFLDIKRILS